MLDISAMRHRLLANNVANADTPGFKRSDVSFLDELASAVKSGDAAALAGLKPKVVKSMRVLATRNDGNNVDIDFEMGELSKNQLLYNINAQLLSKRFSMLKAAISNRP